MKPYLGTLLTLLWMLAPYFRVQAQEKILGYHSEIEVLTDGVLRITETIRVQSDGDRIRHGIYRSLPTRYRDRYGHRVLIPLQVVGASRDGVEERFHLKEESNGLVLYLGDESVTLDPGQYTYCLRYETSRQIGFFPDHDELYWNVTGNGWEFPMDSVCAEVRLPQAAAARLMGWDGFVGVRGSKEKSLSFNRDEKSRFRFTVTRPLAPYEGLSIVLTWPKGIVQPPDRRQKFFFFLNDNLGFVVGLLGLGAVLLYFYTQWHRVGKDPAKGMIMPHFRPPENLAPAATRYLMRMGFDDKTFTAFVLQMAVKGHLVILKDNGEYSLSRKHSEESLTTEERSVLDALVADGGRLDLKQGNHRVIRSAVALLKKQLTATYYPHYFETNRKYFWPGAILSTLVVIASPLAFRSYEATFLTVWLFFWSIGVIAMVYAVLKVWRTLVLSSSARYASVATAIFFTLFSLPFFAGEVFGLFGFMQATSPWTVLVLVAVIFINYFFYHLLKAPSQTGRTVMDQIEGFKMYLSASQGQYWETFYPPDKTSKLFEKYLPYALALDVEKQWSEGFADVMPDDVPISRSLTWYQPGHWDDEGLGTFTSSFSHSFSSAISSSATAPGSSSGSGGGGSSGGGGGGGGGGGW